MPIRICDLAPRYWKATHPDWDPNDPKEWELPECPLQHDEDMTNEESLAVQKQDTDFNNRKGTP